MKFSSVIALLASFILASGLVAGADDFSSIPLTIQDWLPAMTNPPTGELNGTNDVPVDWSRANPFAQDSLDRISNQPVHYASQVEAAAADKNFLMRNIRIGGDVYSKNTIRTIWDNSSENLILRVPYKPLHLTPYVYSGAGYERDTARRRFGQAGGGVELRFTKNWSLFIDVRYAVPEGDQDYAQARAGIRFSF